MKKIVITMLFVLAAGSWSLADGKMFWREKVPPEIPYQRALILHSNGVETLILQSRYEIPRAGQEERLGWVVPVPAVPEIASLPANQASQLFWMLSMATRPRVTSISHEFGGILFILMLGVGLVSLVALILCATSLLMPSPPWFKRQRGRIAQYAALGLLLFLLMGLALPSFVSARGMTGVDVIAEQRVGIYDVRVVRSEAAGDLLAWLNSNNFQFSEADTSAFESYTSRGWCFVVAMINPTGDQKRNEIVTEGLAAPLILRFPNGTPVYPLVLTGTGGRATEILIYLACTERMSAGDRMTLRFAGPMGKAWPVLDGLALADPETFFNLETPEYPYICKFKSTLTPAQMTDDLVFVADTNKTEYREHIVKW